MKVVNPFGQVWGASGVSNFFGEGYPFHKVCKMLPGFDFSGMTFVAKTSTLLSKAGNMPISTADLMPKEMIPRCIYVDFKRGLTLNAVGLSGPGAASLLSRGKWQGRTEPFQISFMSIASTLEERVSEFRCFVDIFSHELPNMKTVVGLQINLSCPNVGVSHDDLIEESKAYFDVLRDFDFNQHVILKFSSTVDEYVVKEITKDPMCWGICISNTITWRSVLINNWEELFPGSDGESPLQHKVGAAGGLGGKPLVNLSTKWIEKARDIGIDCHINGCGGILSPNDVRRYKRAGADSVSIGSVAILRPWRIRSIIKTAKEKE